jgi:uncharacterized membrane protein
VLLNAAPTEDPSWPGFRWQGTEVTRLESFSDAVFGFALTLLVVSLDVPKTAAELFATMRGFPSFAVCFLFLALIWNAHYKFCRRFGLDDGWTRFLTCLLLFVVLFYVYPLKFLFNFSITSALFGTSQGTDLRLTATEFASLMTIYGLGFAAVYFAMLLLYYHAYQKSSDLKLSPLEQFDTRYQIYRFVVLIAVGVTAAALAYLRILSAWSGMIYASLWPLMRIARLIHGRRRHVFVTSSL